MSVPMEKFVASLTARGWVDQGHQMILEREGNPVTLSQGVCAVLAARSRDLAFALANVDRLVAAYDHTQAHKADEEGEEWKRGAQP